MLRKLLLTHIHTQLPWRNMVNLKSFALSYAWAGSSSVRHLLDFFESGPSLHKILLHLATPTFGTQRGRTVSLVCLKRLDIIGGGPPSLLLNHLLIPAGMRFMAQGTHMAPSTSLGPLIASGSSSHLGSTCMFGNFTQVYSSRD